MHVSQLKREKKIMTIKLSYSMRLANQGKGSTRQLKVHLKSVIRTLIE
jgi:hypothetical protein